MASKHRGNNQRYGNDRSADRTTNGAATNSSAAGSRSRNEAKNNSRGTKASRGTRGDKNSGSSPRAYGSKGNATNDISWYAQYPGLLAAAASIPFPYKPGMFVPLTANRDYAIPGVLSLHWVPAIGSATQPQDPINIACHEIYGRIRAAYSADLAIDAPDLGIYFLALDSIFSYIATLKRVYRCLNAYTPQNYVTPEGVLYALGVTPVDAVGLRNDKMHLFSVINELVAMSRKFTCPAVFPLFNRHYWLNDNVYTDAASPGAQFYTFKQDEYLVFELLDTPDSVLAGGLAYQPGPLGGPAGSVDVNALYEYGVSMMNALAGWDESYTISGYLRRAYEGAAVFAVDPLQYQETLIPQYDEIVLSQVENATWLDSQSTSYSKITQDPKTNSLLTDMQVTFSTPIAAKYAFLRDCNTLINCRAEFPTAADVVEASRLITGIGVDQSLVVGSELVTECNLFYATSVASDGQRNWSSFQIDSITAVPTGTGATGSAAASIVRKLFVLDAFDWHPHIRVIETPTEVSYNVVTIYGDIRNITSITDEQLAQINRVCLFSEFSAFQQ